MSNGRQRAWLFTWYDEEEPGNRLGDARYLVYQRERCPTSLRLHWQGYAVFNNPKSLVGVRKLLPGAHWESRIGTHEQARAYCTKQESRVTDPVERGEPPCQGSRSDLRRACDVIVAGGSVRSVAGIDPVTYVRNVRGLTALWMALARPRDFKTFVVVLEGPTGCGKSSHIYRGINRAQLFTKDSTLWWDQYGGEPVVVLDEFYGQLPYEYVLRLCDRYQFMVQYKGGYTEFCSYVLVLTTNRGWRGWYTGLTEAQIDWMPAFARRIDAEYRFAGGVWWKADYTVTIGGFRDPQWTECELPAAREWLRMAQERAAAERGPEPELVASVDKREQVLNE